MSYKCIQIIIINTKGGFDATRCFPIIIGSIQFSSLCIQNTPFFFDPDPYIVCLIYLDMAYRILDFFKLIRIPVITINAIVRIDIKIP